jgi:predicted hydrocarbon binding protein
MRKNERILVVPLLTEALGEQVDVELVQAIGTGDERCEFVVHPRGAGS